MTFSSFTLSSHVFSGVAGLIIGMMALLAPKYSRFHKRVGKIYMVIMTYLILSSIVLSFFNWEKNWWLFLVALFSYYFSLLGYLAVKRKKAGWINQHISGMVGSYVAMVTAFLVTNIHRIPGPEHVPHIVYWILPTIIAIPFIRMTKAKWAHLK